MNARIEHKNDSETETDNQMRDEANTRIFTDAHAHTQTHKSKRIWNNHSFYFISIIPNDSILFTRLFARSHIPSYHRAQCAVAPAILRRITSQSSNIQSSLFWHYISVHRFILIRLALAVPSFSIRLFPHFRPFLRVLFFWLLFALQYNQRKYICLRDGSLS